MDKLLSLATSPECPAIDFSYPKGRGLYHSGAAYKPSDDVFDIHALDRGILRLELPVFVVLPGDSRADRLAALLSVSREVLAELIAYKIALTPDGLVHRRDLSDTAYSPEHLYGGAAIARLLTERGNADKIPEFLTRVLPIPEKVQEIANDPTKDLTEYALSDTAYVTYRFIERYNRVLASQSPALIVHNECRMISESATKYLTALSELA